MAVLVSEQLTAKNDLLCGFWCDDPMFTRGDVQYETYLGGGFWQVGIHFEHTVRSKEVSPIEYMQKRIQYLAPCEETKRAKAVPEIGTSTGVERESSTC